VDQLLQQVVNGLSNGALYALIAVGYTVVYGIIQLINFAHGEVFMIGAFGALATWTYLLGEESLALWVLPIMIAGAIVASVSVALLMERFAYRPLRNAPRLAPLITAIGVSIFLQEAVRLFYPDAKGKIPFPRIDGVTGAPVVIGNVTIQRPAIFTIGALMVCTLLLNYFLFRTQVGRAMQATAQDSDTAKLMGINVNRVIAIAFGVGAALAAVAGVSYGLQISNIDFRMGFIAGLKAFTAAVLGGIGNVNGAVVGGLVLGLVEALAIEYIPGRFGGASWKDVWTFVILILVLVFRPQGLLGARVVERA